MKKLMMKLMKNLKGSKLISILLIMNLILSSTIGIANAEQLSLEKLGSKGVQNNTRMPNDLMDKSRKDDTAIHSFSALAVTGSSMTYYVGGEGASNSNEGIGPYATLSKAVEVINALPRGEYTIQVQGDIFESGGVTDIHNNIAIQGAAASGSAIVILPGLSVWGDGSLTLGNPLADSDQELILQGSVYNAGELVLYSGVTIQNSAGTAIHNDNGNVQMNGGTIQNSITGILTWNGTITMTGGLIQNNHGRGGVYNTGTFYLEGGTIRDNSAERGGGIYNFGAFQMSGGSISGNNAQVGGGIYDDDDLTYAMGTYIFGGDIRITGGSIYSNSANIGGAVYTSSCITIAGNASIPVGDSGQNDIYLGDRLVVEDDWDFNHEIAISAPIYGENYQLVEINPALMAAHVGVFRLLSDKYNLTLEGRLSLSNRTNVVDIYVHSTLGNNVTGVGTISSPYATLQKAVDVIKNTADQTGVIHLMSDIELTATLNTNGDITILSDEIHYITRSETFKNLMIIVSGGSLKLGSPDNSGSVQTPTLIFDGQSDKNVEALGVIIENSGLLSIYNGVALQNNRNNTDTGSQFGTVTNWNVFDMYGGVIRGNRSFVGGVFNHGAFRMAGAACIENNEGCYSNSYGAFGHGGVYNMNLFVMSGGSIRNNVGDYGGGVYNNMHQGNFLMKDGEISNNISHHSGGGVVNQSIFRMSGGSITGNHAEDGFSDGINHVSIYYLSISGNAVIGEEDEIGVDDHEYSWGGVGASWTGNGIVINGSLTNSLPVSENQLFIRVNNHHVELGQEFLYSGEDYTLNWKDSARFIINKEGTDYGIASSGRLCPLLKAESVTIPQENIYYTGSSREFDDIEVSYGGVTLTKDVDYIVRYYNNIDVGQAIVIVQGIGAYSGTYVQYFTILPATIQEIITTVPNHSFKASDNKSLGDLYDFLPDIVAVAYEGGTAILPIQWSLTGVAEYDRRGGTYSFSGRLLDNPNYIISENLRLTTEIVITPSLLVNPVFEDINVPRGTDNAATSEEIGQVILPTVGHLTLEQMTIPYRIDWSNSSLDTANLSAKVTFTGTITYIEPPAWVTLPENLRVTRTVGVFSGQSNNYTTTPTSTPSLSPTPTPIPETVTVNGVQTKLQVNLTQGNDENNIEATLELDMEQLQRMKEENKNELLLEIPISSPKLLELMQENPASNVNISLLLPSVLTSDSNMDISKLNLDPALLETARDTEADLTITIADENGQEQYSWTFTGDKLKNSDAEISDLNLSLSVGEVLQNEEIHELMNQGSDGNSSLEEDAQGLVVNFGYHGDLPAETSVKVYVGNREGLKPGDRVYLYYYNEQSGMLETLPYSSGYTVDEDGYITMNLIHCSNYVILPEQAVSKIVISLKDQIKVSPTEKVLYYGGTVDNKAIIEIELPTTLKLVKSFTTAAPDSAIGEVTAQYRSSNRSVAMVSDDGIITATGNGSAMVYVKLTLYSGKTKVVTILIKVKKADIILTKSVESMQVGETFDFEAQVFGLPQKKLIWTTKYDGVVIINKKTGRAIAKSQGTDFITVQVGTISKTIKVAVINQNIFRGGND